MERNITVILYSEGGPRGVLDPPAPRTERTVYATTRAPTMRERYDQERHGLRPELILWLAHEFEYQGEPFATAEGEEWQIIEHEPATFDGVKLLLKRRRDVG